MSNHSIATVSLSGPLDEEQRAIARTGFGAFNALIRLAAQTRESRPLAMPRI